MLSFQLFDVVGPAVYFLVFDVGSCIENACRHHQSATSAPHLWHLVLTYTEGLNEFFSSCVVDLVGVVEHLLLAGFSFGLQSVQLSNSDLHIKPSNLAKP